MLNRSERDVERITRQVEAAMKGTTTIEYRAFSSIESKPLNWLWPGRVACGKVCMLAGHPGVGKSQLTAALAATVSRGNAWPDGFRCDQGSVVILSAEDDPSDTLRPRMDAAGADTDRVFFLDAVVEGSRKHGATMRRSFDLSADLERLSKMLEEVGGAKLIVIDPVTAYLGGADSHRNADIRALLAPLADLASRHGSAIVCVSHLNKAVGTDALMRISGSLAFVAAARSAWLVAADPDDDSKRLLLPLKNNLALDQGGLRFHVEGMELPSAHGLIETSRVVWDAGSVNISASDVMAAAANREHGSTERDEAQRFLQAVLADGPVEAKQVYADAQAVGIRLRTLKRAKKALAIESVKGGMNGGWEWSLPRRGPMKPEECQEKYVAPFDEVGTLRGVSAHEAKLRGKLVEVEF